MIRIFYSLLFLATLFSVSYFIFEPTYLYYELPWLDIPMHILGGMGVGALASAMMLYRDKKVSLAHMVAFFAVIACAWEVYEYARGVVEYDEVSDYVDTVADTINGLLGVLAAYSFVKK
jgi:hypothetical protein